MALYFFLFALAGCAPIKVQYDYETQVDYSGFSSYNFDPLLDTGLSDLDQRRLLEAVNQYLQASGYRLSEDPDLVLNIYSNLYRDPNQGSVGFGVGGTGGDIGGGVSVGIPLNSGPLQREIVFEMVDARQGRALWQAVSTDQYNESTSPQKKEERFREIAGKVFEGFPPKLQN